MVIQGPIQIAGFFPFWWFYGRALFLVVELLQLDTANIVEREGLPLLN